MKAFIVIVLTLFASTLSSESGEECNDGWVSYADNCYYKPGLDLEYRGAVDLCRNLNSEVLYVNNQEEQDFVTKYLVNRESNLWLTGFINNPYENWFNDSVKRQSAECALIKKGPNVKSEARWLKTECGSPNEVVCKTKKVPPTPPTCSKQWTQHKNRCYWFNPMKLSCQQAEDVCLSLGSHLVSIHSDAENDFVIKFYNQQRTDGGTYIWIGMVSFELPKFHWLDGTPVNYTNWQSGYPVSELNLFCGVVHTGSNYKYWENTYVHQKRYSICSYPLQ